MRGLLQIYKIVRLVGLRRAARMKRRYDGCLWPLRGYVATKCLWTLLETGFLDELLSRGTVDLHDFAARHSLDVEPLKAICDYLDGIGWLRFDSREVQAGKFLLDLMAEPRGLYELGYAYEPVLQVLEKLLRRQAEYGRTVFRRTDWVGLGSGRLCEQLPYRVIGDLVRRFRGRKVLDVGCGDGSLMVHLASRNDRLTIVGIDIDEAALDLARARIRQAALTERACVVNLDMFALAADGELPDALDGVDTLTVCDTFHEYLWDGFERIEALLRGIKRRWPEATIVVGDFCVQPRHWLRRHPTASLEHHLWHDLTRQRLISEQQWREIFARAGLKVLAAEVFDVIGHGYFALR